METEDYFFFFFKKNPGHPLPEDIIVGAQVTAKK